MDGSIDMVNKLRNELLEWGKYICENMDECIKCSAYIDEVCTLHDTGTGYLVKLIRDMTLDLTWADRRRAAKEALWG